MKRAFKRKAIIMDRTRFTLDPIWLKRSNECWTDFNLSDKRWTSVKPDSHQVLWRNSLSSHTKSSVTIVIWKQNNILLIHHLLHSLLISNFINTSEIATNKSNTNRHDRNRSYRWSGNNVGFRHTAIMTLWLEISTKIMQNL